MNENQPNFESLRRLMALKRHETPPPGYFNNFSRQVIARIRAGEADAASFSDQTFGSLPWFLRLFQTLETRPAFAGGFASMLCGLLVVGVVLAQRPESVSMAIMQPPAQEAAPLIASATPPVNKIFIADNSTNAVVNFPSYPIGSTPASVQLAAFPMSGN
jgi:hypothetical protein